MRVQGAEESGWGWESDVGCWGWVRVGVSLVVEEVWT